MTQTCSTCARRNPDEAAFCYHDGAALPDHGRRGVADPAGQRFPSPLVFPSGEACHSFEELALCCQQRWAEAREMLQHGYLERFFGGLGRGDLARAAREAARFPERNRGLDQLLGRLPGHALQPPRLAVKPAEFNLGTLRVGEDRHFTLRLENQGMRLLFGTVSCDPSVWLAVGDAPGAPRKVFELTDHRTLAVHVRGQGLRASKKPVEGRLVIESNGGSVTAIVRAEVPIKPFPEGVMAGALSPRQVAEKAREAPKEAGALFESGAVARWYRDNGWAYPVRAPAASGVAAVQQFFEALGLVKPPHMEIGEEQIELHGQAGAKVEHTLAVHTQENRLAWAHASSDQPWLVVGRIRFRGRVATIPLTVPAVPDHPGEALHATLSVTANGNQRFEVPVTLTVAGQAPVAVRAEPVAAPAANPVAYPAVPAALPVAISVRPAAPRPRPYGTRTGGGGPGCFTWLPAGLLVLTLLGVVARDYFHRAPAEPRSELPAAALDPVPRLAILFHDKKRDDVLERLDLTQPEPTMRFGLVTLHDGKEIGSGAAVRRLTFDPWGRTNNTCLRFDSGEERLFGSALGRWEETEEHSWKGDRGLVHEGTKSVWVYDETKVRVIQLVELVRGEQSNLLDTCRVRYQIENLDSQEHVVGIRFLLDTYIGANDGVPFTIPGDPELCDTLKDMRGAAIPDFLQALEKPSLADPGTIAHLRLKLGDLEPPVRVTLGAWPNEKLRILNPTAGGPSTLWNVPLLSMKSLGLNDSAVTIYWKEEPLAPGGRRDVGFEYGRWNLVAEDSRLAATVDGAFRPEGELTVVAYVHQTGQEEAGATVTLELPAGFQLLAGDQTQQVPKLPRDAKNGNRPVTWKIRAGPIGRYTLTVKTSAGLTQDLPVEIKQSIFD
jgi:hypothetical protein